MARGPASAPGWDIRQEVTHPDPAVAGQQVRQELAGGAASIQLALDPVGAAGVVVRGADDLDLALAGVDFATTRVALKAGARFVPATQQLREVWERRGLAAADAQADLLADPVGAWVVRGGAPGGIEALLAAMASLAAAAAKETPQVRAVKVAGCPFHDAGADDAQELAAILSGGLAYLKAMDAAGLDLAAAARQIHVCVAVDGQFFGDVAKLRALRTVWSRLIEASGGEPEARRAHLHARTSWRMMTARDPWVNLLRTTTAAFAAGVGGAEVVTVLPFDAAVNEPDDFSRRLARNVQIVLQQEASLGRVLDPAGGCWHLEARTAALAERAWSLFQELEGRGGLVASLRDGWFQEKIAATRQARAREVEPAGHVEQLVHARLAAADAAGAVGAPGGVADRRRGVDEDPAEAAGARGQRRAAGPARIADVPLPTHAIQRVRHALDQRRVGRRTAVGVVGAGLGGRGRRPVAEHVDDVAVGDREGRRDRAGIADAAQRHGAVDAHEVAGGVAGLHGIGRQVELGDDEVGLGGEVEAAAGAVVDAAVRRDGDLADRGGRQQQRGGETNRVGHGGSWDGGRGAAARGEAGRAVRGWRRV